MLGSQRKNHFSSALIATQKSRLHRFAWRYIAVGIGSVSVLAPLSGCAQATTSSAIGANPSATTSSAITLTQSGNPPAVPGMVWKPTSQRVNGAAPIDVTTLDHGNIALMWMNPALLKFRFIPGYKYPEKSPSIRADLAPKTWMSNLVAAFNGGFKLSDHKGGYQYHGTVVSPLKPGLATLTVDSSGHLKVGVWSPSSSSDVTAIRQNQSPLIEKGQLKATLKDRPDTWGRSLHNQAKTQRTALGQLADGSLVFATGAQVSAYEIGIVLRNVGAQTAITLDMNRTWPTGYVYDQAVTGKKPVGHKILKATYYPPSKYFVRDKKDFIVAQLAGP